MQIEIRKIVVEPENIVPYLVPGRMIKVSISSGEKGTTTEKEQVWGWGILVNFSKQRINAKNIAQVGRQNKELADIIE